MAALTTLESKLAEVLGLAMAAQDSVQQVRDPGPRQEDCDRLEEALDRSSKLAAEEDPFEEE